MKKIIASLFLVFIVSIALALTIPAHAQENTPTIHIDVVDTTGYPTVTIRLSAWDASGLPLANLTANDFLLREDGGAPFHPQTVQIENNTPLGVVLALDISGSMAGTPIQDAKTAAARFLDHLKPGSDRAALVAFSDPVDTDPNKLNPQRELAFTSDLSPVYDMVEKLTAQGKTQLYNAELKSVQMAAALPVGHRAVLLLSDGRNDPTEVGDPEAAIKLAKKNNIPFFVIGLGDQIDESHLRQLAVETGGLYRSAPRSSELARLFNEMATLLKTQYVLTYESKLPADGSTHKLTITLNTAQGKAEVPMDFGPLPAAGSIPATATIFPVATIAESESGPASIATSAPENQPTTETNVISTSNQTWAWALAAIVSLLLGLFFVLRRSRRPNPTPEVCAQCGFDLTGVTGSCPQCSSTRRLPKK